MVAPEDGLCFEGEKGGYEELGAPEYGMCFVKGGRGYEALVAPEAGNYLNPGLGVQEVPTISSLHNTQQQYKD